MRGMALLGALTGMLAVLLAGTQHLAYAQAGNVSISVDMHLTGQTAAEGTFQASGVMNDSGTASETFQIAADGSSVEGTKTLAGAHGNLTIHFDGPISPVAGKANLLQVSGTWQVVSGTGAYSGMSGGGQINTTLDTAAGTLHADYTGDLALSGSPAGMPKTGTPSTLPVPGVLTFASLALVILGAALAGLSRTRGWRRDS